MGRIRYCCVCKMPYAKKVYLHTLSIMFLLLGIFSQINKSIFYTIMFIIGVVLLIAIDIKQGGLLMNKVIDIFKEKWYLFVISLVISIPMIFMGMMGTWIIGMFTQIIIAGVLISSLLATFIITLPLDSICRRIGDLVGKEIAIKARVIIYISYYIVFGSILFILEVKR